MTLSDDDLFDLTMAIASGDPSDVATIAKHLDRGVEPW